MGLYLGGTRINKGFNYNNVISVFVLFESGLLILISLGLKLGRFLV